MERCFFIGWSWTVVIQRGGGTLLGRLVFRLDWITPVVAPIPCSEARARSVDE